MANSNEKVRSIATRRGDTGETDLLYGKRVPKSDPQIEATGALDELSSALAMAKATASLDATKEQLERIQVDLIALSGEISTPADALERYRESKFPKISDVHLQRLDQELEAAEKTVPKLNDWALPGRTVLEATLEISRSHARKAERRLVALKENRFPLRPVLLQYLNRLSDLLWLLAKKAA
ncbi:MAG TPA: cob(I)yrinic acid a,c-diamide adenosyltransferase [Opitutales bacterium]|nr:cob(I)yrinic acid a,c-diamide adenosyltransferase [Opitutales bacterium]